MTPMGLDIRQAAVSGLVGRDEGGEDVHRHGEHDRAVLLGGDVVQGLQVSQLKWRPF